MNNHKVRRALFSVSEKRGCEAFARALSAMGVEILATGGTRKLIADAGIPVREVSEVTGFPEMMDGRVKTLHPKIHGGLLALRDEPTHMAAMEEHGIGPIDLACVNLYPFEETIAKGGVDRSEAIEQIDIGGPTMVRSAAKNHAFVAIVTNPNDYGRVERDMKSNDGAVSDLLRRELAQKAFALTALYDTSVAGWLFGQERSEENPFPSSYSLAGRRYEKELRYGENSHQKAAFYRTAQLGTSVASAKFLGGKDLSYNNFVDLDAALGLALEFEEPFCCVIKHTNPCGAACAATLAAALESAWSGDPLSAFGSVLAFNRPVDKACAEFLTGGNRFVEAIIAPSFAEDAEEQLRTGAKWGKNVRMLACGSVGPAHRPELEYEVKHLRDGFLVQERDRAVETRDDFDCVTETRPTTEQETELLFANLITKHVKSNAIVLVKGTRVLGVGAGQMSRVDSVKLAVEKAGDEVLGSVLGSDAFFPFPDGVETAMDAGVAAILQPGGSIRDKQVVAVCNERKVPMVFTGHRHFRH
ncbi:MAG: bifunctional phosphoribosylaminoimidazolecarboxamide formyltransferase/inosine monophosphate cyclohydrolase [Planctomycetes bacterium]|jgi:phosphoribosylaminoimidazolecarboxamide formyltransferase/IMP cyclohydrolase|nr:bifunctional phosphoribosylaminoimidazolecarboxamide formyltransferase/inosine monophosphate cyclohydrolase [Planctomycetota bacterium]